MSLNRFPAGQQRDLVAVAKAINASEVSTGTVCGNDNADEHFLKIRDRIETRLVRAAWTLRRIPDRERGFMRLRTMVWPHGAASGTDYAPTPMTSLEARRRTRIEPRDIDEMQPSLDLLLLLPDVLDRQIVFWAAWHQDGERSTRIAWAKVRRSMGADLSRWTLKRRNDDSLNWLARLVLLQA